MGEICGSRENFPTVKGYHDEWLPLPAKEDINQQYADIKTAWDMEVSPVGKATNFMVELGLGGWTWPAAASPKRGIKPPRRFIKDMKKWWIDPPVFCS